VPASAESCVSRKAVRAGARLVGDPDLLRAGLEHGEDVLERPRPAQISLAGIMMERPQPLVRALYQLGGGTADGALANVGEQRLKLLVVADARVHARELAHSGRS
jgi:hypothetical protein